MAAKRKVPDTDGQKPAIEIAERSVADLREVDESASARARPSPVHGLQAGLEAEFVSHDPGLSRREVYGTVIVFCFAVWWALYMLTSAVL